MGSILDELIKDPSRAGPVVLLIIMVAAFMRRWIVPFTTLQDALKEKDRQIDSITRDRDEYRMIAFKSMEITERTQKIRGKAFEQREDA